MVDSPETARKFLEDNNLSQADMAREMGISRQNIHRYLTGRTPPAGFWVDFEQAGDKRKYSGARHFRKPWGTWPANRALVGYPATRSCLELWTDRPFHRAPVPHFYRPIREGPLSASQFASTLSDLARRRHRRHRPVRPLVEEQGNPASRTRLQQGGVRSGWC